MFFRLYFRMVLIVLFLISCRHSEDIKLSENVIQKDIEIKVKYAKHFGFRKKDSKTFIFITENYQDTIYFEVKKTCYRMAILGTIPVFQLYLLNAWEYLVAIDDIKYYHNQKIKELYNAEKIVEILPNLQWNYEKLLLSKPNVLISYSRLTENVKLQELLEQNDIQHLLYLDYLEQEPLARAEWIKVLGCITHKETLADSIFNVIETKYNSLKKAIDTVPYFPKVITEVMYGDVWYIAGNKSYIAQLIRDAGGKYAFDFHDYENSKPYSLEYVIKYASDADVWVHLHSFRTLNEMKNANEKYTLLKAFQNKRCYNNNKITNEYGYNDYYESGICLPHLVLSDLIKIFHANKPIIKDSLNYYYCLSEK